MSDDEKARAEHLERQLRSLPLTAKDEAIRLIVAALRAERRKVWEVIDDKLDSDADTYFALINTQARRAIEAAQRWCREQAEKEKDGENNYHR